MNELAPSLSERIVRGSALAAMIALAAALVFLGIALDRPTLAPIDPAPTNPVNAENSARSHR
jgi:hypothetical protein